jgi:EpsI family protein
MMRYRLVIVNTLLLLALGGSMYGKRIETVKIKKTDFLSRLPLNFRDWKSESQVLTPRELELLEPDDQVIRIYTSPDKHAQIQLSVIAGHRKKTVHTPGYCMIGGGWETVTAQNAEMRIGDENVPISRSVMSNDKGQMLLVTFFFTDGGYNTPSLTRFQLQQLMKRFGTGIPLGALVRILTPVPGDRVAAAEAVTTEFAQATLPDVMKALRETKLETE